jgi:cyclin-dependent kinase
MMPYMNPFPLVLSDATLFRLLGTPNEEVWPGVAQLPDYKPTFPQWAKQEIARLVPHLEESGIDLLRVRFVSHSPSRSRNTCGDVQHLCAIFML